MTFASAAPPTTVPPPPPAPVPAQSTTQAAAPITVPGGPQNWTPPSGPTSPTFANAPDWDYSAIYAHPKPESCQSVAVGYAKDLRDEGYTPRLAEVITPQKQLHYVATFERSGETWAMDPLHGRDPLPVKDLPYIWVGKEKLAASK